MNDIAGLASTLMAMSQSQTQDQISISILKMNAQAEAAMAECSYRTPARSRPCPIRQAAALSIFLPEEPSSLPRVSLNPNSLHFAVSILLNSSCISETAVL